MREREIDRARGSRREGDRKREIERVEGAGIEREDTNRGIRRS